MSETPKFTDGPWHPGHLGSEGNCQCANVVDEGYAGGICTIHIGNGKPIGEGGNDAPPREQAIANMHLIAAAPELFAVARYLLLVDFDMFTEHDELLLEDTVKMAQTAISKALNKAPS